MWPLVTYSNYFEIVHTMIFLNSQTGLILGIVIYLYNIYNDYTKYIIIIFAASGF